MLKKQKIIRITTLYIFVFLLLILATSCGESGKDLSPQERITQIIESMTLEDKAGQLLIGRCPGEGYAEDMKDYRLGGYTFYRQNFNKHDGSWLSRKELKAMLDDCAKDMKIAPLFAVDEEGGSVTRLSENPKYFPDGKSKSPREILAAGGVEALKKDSAEKSNILKDLGFNVNFAPVADVVTDEKGFMYERSMGGDAKEVSEAVAAAVETMEGTGMGTVLKHFPGYGNNDDTHQDAVWDKRPYEEYEEKDYLPFEAGIKAGSGAVMMSHIRVSAIDSTRPASLSPKVIKELRDKLGFDGVVMTDDIAMGEMLEDDRDGHAAVEAIAAGNDMVISTNYIRSYEAILKAVESDEIKEERLDKSLKRIIEWKMQLGIVE